MTTWILGLWKKWYGLGRLRIVGASLIWDKGVRALP
jgi:hypothetical protein